MIITRHQYNGMKRLFDQIEALAKAQLLRWFPGQETVSSAFNTKNDHKSSTVACFEAFVSADESSRRAAAPQMVSRP